MACVTPGSDIRRNMTDTTCDITDEQIVAALAVDATAAGAAALLSGWHKRTVTADEVVRRVIASERLRRVATFCAEAQGRSSRWLAEERFRAMAGPRRWRERRARK
jgi:hypothetical protein